MEETTNRIAYLAKNFDIFDVTKQEDVEKKIKDLHKNGFKTNLIESSKESKTTNNPYENLIAIVSIGLGSDDNQIKNVSVSSDVFASIIESDPTSNKMYVQWILNQFTKLLKDEKKDSTEAAIRLVVEDLPQANKYLTLFEGNKRKQKFKKLCNGISTLKEITDLTDINQYKSLSQLFDAVDPFIERKATDMEKKLLRYVESGQAIIPVRDRKFTVYIPLTNDASTVFAGFASWCTARESNGMYSSYTTGHKKPNGKPSNLYIIINNKFFTGESKEIYQIHFETHQLKDRSNSGNVKIDEVVIKQSDALSDYFYNELMVMAKGNKTGIEKNTYLDYLLEFGFIDSLFEFIDVLSPTIRFMSTRILKRIPDLTRFKNLEQLYLLGAEISEIHPSIGNLKILQVLCLNNNKLETIPKEIGNLKNLEVLILVGNKLTTIPDEIRMLDKTNGGNLYRIGVKKDEIGDANYAKLQRLLPSVHFSNRA